MSSVADEPKDDGYEQWKADRIAEGLAQLDRGEFIEHAEVFRQLRERYARRKLGGTGRAAPPEATAP